jgi:hypothetical protein
MATGCFAPEAAIRAGVSFNRILLTDKVLAITLSVGQLTPFVQLPYQLPDRLYLATNLAGLRTATVWMPDGG